ncbi:two-component sensor histidine kinase [Ginsengibacter hankyongi]|uniref:histidine kinase n=2 Tax=Ginsengibacter hankyongi TaxID=2607284 RepID=A0A5J5II38_9BACT|nr:two-component sensor histidine kinase [Ginsengibacter hankyongi]
MHLLLIDMETRIIIGVTAMVLLFASFIIAFISSQKKKIQYHKNLNILHEQQRLALTQQNESLETRVEERTLELSQQKEMLQKSLNSLKSAQLQLIQSEKMASLGELTAGIAHEIQNPLNFVNNFSDINLELLIDMKDEINKGNLDEVRAIANDITENEEKINHHGRRADAIVKGMLQHSGGSTGEKEPTDINVLCDEYLRLSYHGFKAKDKSFNTAIKTDFDSSLGKIEIVPQDIGRVLLNLFTNAFYALNKKKTTADSSYQPMVFVQTIKVTDSVKIIIQDNGVGIPPKIADKIFQPFFTTKPTGEGTGLGLSISYDIVKAHGGKLTVESEEGVKTTFIIEIPLT